MRKDDSKPDEQMVCRTADLLELKDKNEVSSVGEAVQETGSGSGSRSSYLHCT